MLFETQSEENQPGTGAEQLAVRLHSSAAGESWARNVIVLQR